MRTCPLVLSLALSLPACGDDNGTSSGGSGMTQTSDDCSGFAGCPDPSTGTASEPTEGGTASDTEGGTASGTGGEQRGPGKYGELCSPDAAIEFFVDLPERACASAFPAGTAGLRIVLYRGSPPTAGEYTLEGGSGRAYFYKEDGTSIQSMTGTLTVEAATADGLVGAYDVTLPDNSRLSGDFDALYCPVEIFCE